MRTSLLRRLHVKDEDERGARGSLRMLPIAIYGGLGLLALLVGVMIWFAIAQPVKVLPRIGTAPQFTLVDQQGQWLADSDLRGRLVYLSLGHSRCGAPCLAQVEGLNELAARRHEAMTMLMVSLDAEYDTPEILQSYAAEHGLDPQLWRLLTGRASEIKALIGGEFGIYYNRPAPDQPLEFEPRIILIDGSGMTRAIYKGAQFDLGRAERDLALLQSEAGSTGLMRSVYEASHLFLCYPD